jgi:uncharacterized membrane protein
MMWIAFAIFAAFFYALESVLDKVAVSRQIKKPAEATIIGGGAVFVSLIVVGLLGGGGFAPLNVIVVCALSGIIAHAVNWFYFLALRKEEVSRVMPVYATMPVLTTIFAYFVLGERFSMQTYIGIALVVTGAILISLKSNARGFRFSKVMTLVLFSAVLGASRTILTKYIEGAATDWTIILWTGVGGLISVLITEFFHNHKKILRREYVGVHILVAGGIVGGFATVLYIFSILRGPASLAAALIEIQPIFVLTIASIFAAQFPELSDEVIHRRAIVQKILAVMVIAGGGILVALGG